MMRDLMLIGIGVLLGVPVGYWLFALATVASDADDEMEALRDHDPYRWP